eukprot:230903-Pyramimonas_sp.AAC.1
MFLIVQDERAFKYTTGAMGATGHKICGLCSNIVNFKSSLLPCPNNFLVPSTEVDVSKYRFHSHAALMEIQHRLKGLYDSGQKNVVGETGNVAGI